jgi:hypothetical protein
MVFWPAPSAGAAARPQEGAPARSAPPGPGSGSRTQRPGTPGGGSAFALRSDSIPRIPRSSELRHSGNGDSERVILARVSLLPLHLFGDFTTA